MTTMNQARTAAYQRMIDEWPIDQDDDISLWRLIQADLFGPGAFKAFVTGDLRTPYCFDDEVFSPPEDPETKRRAAWTRISVRNLSGGQQTLGSVGRRKFTRSAIVRAEVFTAPGTGLKSSDLLCEKVLRMYEGRYLAGALVYDGVAQEIGLVDEGRWKLSTVQVSFDYEQIK